jgi:hypothetical protein
VICSPLHANAMLSSPALPSRRRARPSSPLWWDDLHIMHSSVYVFSLNLIHVVYNSSNLCSCTSRSTPKLSWSLLLCFCNRHRKLSGTSWSPAMQSMYEESYRKKVMFLYIQKQTSKQAIHQSCLLLPVMCLLSIWHVVSWHHWDLEMSTKTC